MNPVIKCIVVSNGFSVSTVKAVDDAEGDAATESKNDWLQWPTSPTEQEMCKKQ